MGSVKDKEVERLERAVKQLIEEEKAANDNFVTVSGGGGDGDDADSDHRLLSKLLSQLETLKNEDDSPEEPNNPPVEAGQKNENSGSSASEMSNEDIVGELKKIRRQNFITHCLLSALIVLTITWQLSEVSLILKIKDGFSNPLRTIGGMFKGMIMKPNVSIGQEEDKHGSDNHKPNPLLTTSSLPGLKIPEFPHVELPPFDFDHEED